MEIAIAAESLPAPSRGRWPFLETIGWGVLIMIVWALVQVLIFAAYGAAYLYKFGLLQNLSLHYLAATAAYEAGQADVFFVATIVSNIVTVAVILLIVLLKGHAPKDYLSLHPVRMSSFLKWVGILAAFVIGTEGAAAFLKIDFGTDSMVALYAATHSIWLYWATAVLAAPLFEEVMFRGFLFRGFRPSFLGTGGTIVLTALLWASLHVQYNIYGIAVIAATGILFGIARIQTGSLLVPMALHATLNFSDLLLFAMNST